MFNDLGNDIERYDMISVTYIISYIIFAKKFPFGGFKL